MSVVSRGYEVRLEIPDLQLVTQLIQSFPSPLSC